MLRAMPRRLWLEACEERFLPAAHLPVTAPATADSGAHASTGPAGGDSSSEDDDSEYANNSNTATDAGGAKSKTPAQSSEYPPTAGNKQTQSEYVPYVTTEYATSYPAIPPSPAAPKPIQLPVRANECKRPNAIGFDRDHSERNNRHIKSSRGTRRSGANEFHGRASGLRTRRSAVRSTCRDH